MPFADELRNIADDYTSGAKERGRAKVAMSFYHHKKTLMERAKAGKYSHVLPYTKNTEHPDIEEQEFRKAMKEKFEAEGISVQVNWDGFYLSWGHDTEVSDG